jgi:hypothetical protein
MFLSAGRPPSAYLCEGFEKGSYVLSQLKYQKSELEPGT